MKLQMYKKPMKTFILLIVLIISINFLIVGEVQADSEYNLKIEVDYYPGLLWPEVIEAFNFLDEYFTDRGIETEVVFDSPNNIIGIGHGYVTNNEQWRDIERQYHDFEESHIYVVLANSTPGPREAEAHPSLGVGLSLPLIGRNYTEIRFTLMHEIGHSIGIGLYNDVNGTEIYSSTGFMGGSPNTNYYSDEDWESAFAPNGKYGDGELQSARIWNRFSVVGEIYDLTADISGRAIDIEGNPISNINLVLTSAGTETPYWDGGYVGDNGEFHFKTYPGNFSLESSPFNSYILSQPITINVDERDNIGLGDIVLKEETNSLNITIVILISIILLILLSLAYYKRKYK